MKPFPHLPERSRSEYKLRYSDALKTEIAVRACFVTDRTESFEAELSTVAHFGASLPGMSRSKPNVLKGDMSIVGPRPERPFFVQRFLEEIDLYNTRHMFKAGITGWAQVNGWRGDTSIAKRVEYDLYYLRNWSLTLDLQIITMTLFRLFTSKNAY